MENIVNIHLHILLQSNLIQSSVSLSTLSFYKHTLQATYVKIVVAINVPS